MWCESIRVSTSSTVLGVRVFFPELFIVYSPTFNQRELEKKKRLLDQMIPPFRNCLSRNLKERFRSYPFLAGAVGDRSPPACARRCN